MKFTVSQSAIERALQVVTKGMATNSTLPVLAGIYIRAAEGMLEFQTTNLTISIRHKIAANVEEEGATVIAGKVLVNIVRNLPDAAITFESFDSLVSITCDKSHYRLKALDANTFPDFPELALETSIELPSALLQEMVDKVYRVTSKDSSRPILSGVLLTVEENVIRLVATDSYRLAVCDSTAESSSAEEGFRAIIGGRTFHEVLSLPSMTDKILVGTTTNQVIFVFGNTTYVTRRIEGNFPNFRQLLPKSCTTTATIPVEGFGSSLKRVSALVAPNSPVRIDVDPDGNIMRLSASSPDQGESTEMLPVDVEGTTLSIALNVSYVLDCVAAVSGGELALELQSAQQPAIFKSYGQVNYLYLLMPVRL